MQTSDVIASMALFVSISTFGLGYFFNWKAERTKRKPILAFEYRPDMGWFINNVGNGPALNIVIAFKGQFVDWKYFVRIPALAEDSTFHISWIGHLSVWSLGAVYTDFQRIQYTSKSMHDENFIEDGNTILVPQGYEVPRHWHHAKIDDPELE